MVKKQYEVSIHQQNCMLYAFGVLFNSLAIFTVEGRTSTSPSVAGKTVWPEMAGKDWDQLWDKNPFLGWNNLISHEICFIWVSNLCQN